MTPVNPSTDPAVELAAEFGDLAAALARTPAVQPLTVPCGELKLLRLDQLWPLASGNKVYKLVGHALAAQRAGKSHLLSFGGAWSNHLHAMAHLCAALGWRSTGVVRGLYADPDNPTLGDARRAGMRLQRVDKATYARRRQRDYLAALRAEHADAWLVPEGGDDRLGRWGLGYLARALRQCVPAGATLVLAAGTGTTARALALHLAGHCRVVAALVVADAALAARLAGQMCGASARARVVDASGRGYGRLDEAQLRQLAAVLERDGALLDPLYSGKALAVARALAGAGERVYLLHSGGVQGWRGFVGRPELAPHPGIERALQRVASA